MTLHAIVSGTLVTAEATPLGDHLARITSGHAPVGRRVVLGYRPRMERAGLLAEWKALAVQP